MQLSRRGFLGLLATGTVSACVLAKIPTAWIPEPVRRYAAIDFMRAVYNDWSAEQGQPPERLEAGSALFEAYASEIVVCQRFTVRTEAWPTRRSLMFKATPLWESALLEPWEFHVSGPMAGGRMGVRQVTMRPTMWRRAA